MSTISKKSEDLNESISSLKQIIKERNYTISSLKDQIKKQEPIIKDYNLLKTKCTTLENDLLTTKNEYEILKSNQSFLEIELEKKNTEIENYTKKIEELKSELEKLKNNIEQLRSDKKKKENEILKHQEKGIRFDILEEENDNLNEKIIILNNLLAQKDKEILNLKNINNEINKTNSLLTNQVNEFKKIVKKKDKNYDDLSTQKKSDKVLMNEILNKNIQLINDNHDLKNNNNFLNDELNDAVNKMTVLNHQISTNSLELKENKNIIDEIKLKNEKLESINKDFINQIQNLHMKFMTESKKNSELTNQMLNFEKNIYDLKTIIDKNNKIISDLSKNRDEININNDTLKKELDEINSENTLLKKEKLQLENELKKLSDEKNNNGDNIYKLEQNQILLQKNIEKITNEKKEAMNNIQQLKKNIQMLNEQIASSKNEKNDLISQMNAIDYQNRKNAKLEQYYENYIKSLNNQIYELESQIEILQNKVTNISGNYKKENEYNYNMNLLREQISNLQQENKRLKEIVKMKESQNNSIVTNYQNRTYEINSKKNYKQMPFTQTNRSKITNESENDYLKQFISDFHKQIDDLNIDTNIMNDKNIKLNNNIKNTIINNSNSNDDYNIDEVYKKENNYGNYEYNNDEVNQNENNFLNNSNDIEYEGDDNQIIYNISNFKDNEDIKSYTEKKESHQSINKDINKRNELMESMPNMNNINIDDKIKN